MHLHKYMLTLYLMTIINMDERFILTKQLGKQLAVGSKQHKIHIFHTLTSLITKVIELHVHRLSM